MNCLHIIVYLHHVGTFAVIILQSPEDTSLQVLLYLTLFLRATAYML